MHSQREMVRAAVDAPHGLMPRAGKPQRWPLHSYIVPEADVRDVRAGDPICTREGVFWSVREKLPAEEPAMMRLLMVPLSAHTVEAHNAQDVRGGWLS